MSQIKTCRTETGGAEVTIAAMDEVSRMNIGMNTYRFVRRMMQNPEYREMIRARAEQIRAAGKA